MQSGDICHLTAGLAYVSEVSDCPEDRSDNVLIWLTLHSGFRTHRGGHYGCATYSKIPEHEAIRG